MAVIINDILCTVMLFLLSYAWAAYCLENALAALAAASVITLCGGYLIFTVFSRAERKKRLKRAEKEKIAAFADFLQFNAHNAELFAEMLKFFRCDIVRAEADNLVVRREEKIFVSLLFERKICFDSLRKEAVKAAAEECGKMWVFGLDCENALLEQIRQHVDVCFFDARQTYGLFSQADKLPLMRPVKRKKASVAANYAFCRKRFRWYLSSALFTAVMAFFSFFPLYLLVWATALFVLALYSLFNRRFNGDKEVLPLSKI